MSEYIDQSLFCHYKRFRYEEGPIAAASRKKRIVLLSDTHISSGKIFNREIYQKAVAEILSLEGVDYIIHLGDLTHDGTFLNYETALECIKPLKDKIYLIPGNHDAKNVGYLLFEELFGARTFQIEDEDLFILGLDSSIPDLDPGKIGFNTIEKLNNVLSVKQNKIKILCFHHQLLPIPLTGRERSAILDGGDALKVILEAGVDIILNGHRHISNIYSISNGKNEVVIFNNGTTSCNKTRYKELFSYSIMDIYDYAVTFTTKLLQTDETVRRGRYIRKQYSPLPLPDRNKPFLKVVHISNTHFSADNFIDEIYQEAVRQINELAPHAIIHSGDLTNANKLSEFELAVSKLMAFERTPFVVPGNTDLSTFGWQLFRDMIGSYDPYYEDDRLRIVGLNSVDRSLNNGIIGRRKMASTIEMFNEKKPGKINILTFHNNIIPHPNTKFDAMLMDSGAVLKNFTAPAHGIHLILTGHDHISFSLQLENTIISSSGTVSSKDYLDLKGNTYNIISIYKEGLIEIEKVYVRSGQKEMTGQYLIDF